MEGEVPPASLQGDMAALKPHAQVHLLSPTDKCKVCNEAAAKHVHYGAMTCFSCRAFFRRSIQNKTASTYVCRRAKNCEINLKTRKNCQSCRYARCLAVGMKPTWVLSEEERQRRFRKNREKQEAGGRAPAGRQPGKCGPRSRGSSLNELTGDFELLEGGGLGDSLPGLLLLEQAAEDRAREAVPVILEKQHNGPEAGQQGKQSQQHVVVKSELCGTDREGVEQTGHTGHYFGLPLGEPSKTTTSYFVKAEPKSTFSSPYPLEPSLRGPEPRPAAPGHQPGLLYVTSASQYSHPSPGAYMPHRLSQAAPPPPPRPAFLSSTPSVIVQTAASSTRSFEYRAPSMNYPPESDFPLEVGSFATVEAEMVSPGLDQSQYRQPYPATPTLTSEEYERQLEVGLEYVDSVYSDSSDDEEAERVLAIRQRILKEPEIHFNEEDDDKLTRLKAMHDERYRSVNFGEELIKEMIMCSMFGIPVSTSAAISGYRLTVERITRIAHNLESFTSLLKCDQNALLKENADLLVSLRGAIFFDSKKKGVDQVLISMGVDDMKTIKTVFAPLLKENAMRHIDYKTFNSIQAIASPITEQRYNYLQARVADSIPDEMCIILITYIILFSTDFCVLSDRAAVERTQELFTVMLYRYLYSKEPRAKACLTISAALSSVSAIREMADIKKSRSINQHVKISS